MNSAKASTVLKPSMLSLESRQPETSLDRRFGQIALSALVAALPYRSENKKTADTAAQSRE